jgi:pyruvate formate lyase activating enzyme
VRELFEKLHEAGINTALDTAGMKPTKDILAVLQHTDTVLCDIKFTTDELYEKYLGMKLESVLEFLSACEKQGCDTIIRHVVVPNLTDTPEEVLEIKRLALSVCTPKKIELLPFRKLCVEKYDKLGIPFPLADTPECSDEMITELRNLI